MIAVYENMSIQELKDSLKKEVENTSIKELYELSYKFNEDIKYLPREYKTEYKKSVLKVIIIRFNNLKKDTEKYNGNLSKEDIKNIKYLLSNYEDKISYILKIIVIYASYVILKPIHTIGTTFPGSLSIYEDGENYFCPIKKYYMNNPNAVCKFCVAKNTNNI